jgi:hypothetical protein
MKVWRKPETAQWHDDSAQLVDDVDVALKVKPWVDELRISFDATKDKGGERHTRMRISLTERDVEHLYEQLLRGRKEAVDAAHLRIQKLMEQFKTIAGEAEAEVSHVEQVWAASTDSNVHAHCLNLQTWLRGLGRRLNYL